MLLRVSVRLERDQKLVRPLEVEVKRPWITFYLRIGGLEISNRGVFWIYKARAVKHPKIRWVQERRLL